MASQQPEKTFRLGLVSASIFTKESDAQEGGGKKRTTRHVVVQKRYKDSSGEWQSANSFFASELPLALRVMTLAQDYVERAENAEEPF